MRKLRKKTRVSFDEVKEILRKETDEEIVWQTQTQICFENDVVYTLLENETEQLLKSVGEKVSCAFVEICSSNGSFTEGYSCYIQMPEGEYCIDLTLHNIASGRVEIDFYKWEEVDQIERGYEHLNIEKLSKQVCSVLYQMAQYVLVTIEKSKKFRMYFVTGMFNVWTGGEWELIKRKAEWKEDEFTNDI